MRIGVGPGQPFILKQKNQRKQLFFTLKIPFMESVKLASSPTSSYNNPFQYFSLIEVIACDTTIKTLRFSRGDERN
jgi:hypothetical protein